MQLVGNLKGKKGFGKGSIMLALTKGDKLLPTPKMCVNKLKIGHKKIIILRPEPKQTSDIKLIKANGQKGQGRQ